MKKQAGFTLVELMIAGVIGIFLMASLMNLFIATNRSVSLSDALAQNQESGRFALDYITRFSRLAGYSSNFDIPFNPPVLTSSGLMNATLPACAAGACSENNPADAKGDRLSIPLIADDKVTRSCTGTAVVPGTSLANVFWVSNSVGSENELRCQTYNFTTGMWIDNNPVSIVNNIQSFEFQVGIASTPTNRNVSRYINLATLEDPSNTLSFNQIRSIRIAVLTTSQDELNADKLKTNIDERKYTLLDGPLLTIKDGNLRQIFSNTIELPNMIEGSIFN